MTTSDVDLRRIVFDNLNSAVENDQDLEGWTAHDIAVDLTVFAADCEDQLPEDLLPHVAAWLQQRKPK